MWWLLGDLQTFSIATPVGSVAFLLFVLFYDQLILLPAVYLTRAIKGPLQPSKEQLPDGMLVIPSLLRNTQEREDIQGTVGSVIKNDYPGKMLVVVSIDGFDDAPSEYAKLETWVAAQQSTLPVNVWLYVTGTPKRRGKPLAIEQGVRCVKARVAAGEHAEFPKLYFSTDADADLGAHALEYLARRLCKKNLIGNPGRAVAGCLNVRSEQYWRGWRHFFSLEGQLTLQVARHYMVSNMIRFNIRPFPVCGIPGALYCTWTDVLLAGPEFMGFMKTINRLDWVKWWFGHAPPKFSESKAPAIPELLAGDTDDTVSAFMALMARWENGRLTLDAPRTPLHALYYALRTLLFDRGLRYEPAAHVYTASPSTIGSLWRQRMRWNAARIEVAGRFKKSFRYHWDLSAACMGSVGIMLKCLFAGTFAYFEAPFGMAKTGIFLPVALGLVVSFALLVISTVLAMLIDGAVISKWRLFLALPMALLYMPVYGFWAAVAGMAKDLFWVGNCTKFAPETTLIKGGSERIALMARARRAAVLVVRAAIYGDVPLGTFWLGWGETAWTPSGFKGWTTGKRPTLLERLRYGAGSVTAPVVAPAPAPAVAAATFAPILSLVPPPPALSVEVAPVRSSVIPMRPRRSSMRPPPISIAPPSHRAA